jgi:hypothetical protein
MTRVGRLSLLVAAVGTIAAAPASASAGVISTIAGTGVAGLAGDDGPAVSAELSLPRAVSALPDGGLLVADRANNRVRRVWPDGTITTTAGSGPTGASNGDFAGDGGPATDARLDFLHDAEPTADGGFLISDTRNQRIRYVSPTGMIDTVAGSGPFGCFCDGGFYGDGGQATAARLNNPHGIAVNPDGTYLIADTDNNRVRRVAGDGTITTVAGSGPTGNGNGGFAGDDGPATSARLDRPFDVAPMPDGGFLVADTGNQVIRRVDGDGTITTVAGHPDESGFSGDDGPATSARLSSPHGVGAMADGGFLIADENNQRVRRVAPDGTITTAAGSGPTGDANGAYGGDGGPATEALLNRPKSVAAAPDGFLIADESNNRIRFVDLPQLPAEASPATLPALSLALRKRRLSVGRRRVAKMRFTSSIEALVLLELRRRGKLLASLQDDASPGLNTIVLRRRLLRELAPGRYQLVLSADGADGQHAEGLASLRVKRVR